jgi:hypothetical protein
MMCILTRLYLADTAAGGAGIMSDKTEEAKITTAETIMKVRSGLGVTAVQKPRAQTLGFCVAIAA